MDITFNINCKLKFIEKIANIWYLNLPRGGFDVLKSAFSLPTSGTTPPPIIYKRVSSFVWVWDDRGTGATRGITVWRPQAVQSGFYALGDVGIPLTNSPAPESSAILFKAIESDALHPPVAFSEVWRDVDSGGQYDGRILKMLPKSGYTCLGFVAVQSWTSDPELDLFRCVKTNLSQRELAPNFLWNDVGSESAGAVSLFQNLPSGSDTFALDANTFSAIPKHSDIVGSPALLNGRFVKNHQDINLGLPEAAVNIYETTDISLIWNDKGTGAILGLSVWRSKGKSTTYSLGDIAYPRTEGEPNRGFVVKAVNNDALGVPVDFREIYRTSGTGGVWDGSFHQPICSAGYRAIGHVAVRGFSKPAADSVRCIKDEYTTPGEWKFIWNDEKVADTKDAQCMRQLHRTTKAKVYKPCRRCKVIQL
ncbi:hypothetical protein BSL78_08194 [Apostichopus japonicus]|uniref:DUF946 domain-containing protein n=1 Tax=Stichopus japonicus TaxID=307972 RepID=A0A2G8L3S6_STIJA|nr:hypothetical protein BSL78_08194 [Apostichopus japonicus]